MDGYKGDPIMLRKHVLPWYDYEYVRGEINKVRSSYLLKLFEIDDKKLQKKTVERILEEIKKWLYRD